MESISHFQSIDELVTVFDRERILFRDMFEKRRSMTYRKDIALEVVEYKKERIQFLIDYGIIHENGDFIELEDVYIHFFEDVLAMNEEISIASVKEFIDSLKENMNYFLEETNEHRKFQYHTNVRKILRKIGLRTLKNVIDLNRNVDVAYKQEQNFKIKKEKLKKLDDKRENIKALMIECENIIDSQIVFFKIANDSEMQRACMDVRNDFTKAYHNLLEIEHQIIRYLNQIELQNTLLKKIRRIKYLKDHLIWRTESNVEEILKPKNPLWMENRPYNRVFLSLNTLTINEEIPNIVRRIYKRKTSEYTGRIEADPIDAAYMNDTIESHIMININEMWNAFQAQGSDLFNFIINFSYSSYRNINEHIILFCQMATEFSDRLIISNKYQLYQDIEYNLIYAKQDSTNI